MRKVGRRTLTFISKAHLKKLVAYSRKPNAISIARELEIDVINTFCPKVETFAISFILQCFHGHAKMIQQYHVDKYFIDLYFPEHKIALECDEPSRHSGASGKTQDKRRETEIKNIIRGCQFVRFEPKRDPAYLATVVNHLIALTNGHKACSSDEEGQDTDQDIHARRAYSSMYHNKFDAVEILKLHTEALRLRKESIRLQTEAFKIQDELIAKFTDAITSGLTSEPSPLGSTSSQPNKADLLSNSKIQQYHKDDLEHVVAVHDGIHAAAKAINGKVPALTFACERHSVYCEHRWFCIDESDPAPMCPREIPATVEFPKRHSGPVAKLSKDGSTIVKVYPSLEKAAIDMDMKQSAAITIAMQTFGTAHGFKWMSYDTCTDAMKDAYDGEVVYEKAQHGIVSTVQQIDPKTKEIIKTYASLQDACNEWETCHKTLNRKSDKNEVYKGFLWRVIKHNANNE